MYSLDVEQFLSIIFALAIMYYDSCHLEICLKWVSTINFQPLMNAHVNSGLSQKSSRFFFEYLSRKLGFFG